MLFRPIYLNFQVYAPVKHPCSGVGEEDKVGWGTERKQIEKTRQNVGGGEL